MPKKFSQEEYKNIFKERYPDYELLSDYTGDKNYIRVKCKICGNEWNTKPNWLKHGAGCKKCYYRRSAEMKRKAKEDFIQQAKTKHGDVYDYSKVDYKGNKIPVILICPKHGEFPVRPDKHLSRGDGCPECARTRNGIKRRLSQAEFTARSGEMHNFKYDYSKVFYEGYDKPVIIICPKHGEFIQLAGAHLWGTGCPTCSESHLEKKMAGFLNKNNIFYVRQKKFDWLGRMSLDFFLPDFDIAIECQGLQHYSDFYFNKWDHNSTLERIVERDVEKYRLCKENNIQILYFSKSNKIFDISSIYTEENTFTSYEKLIELIKSTNGKKSIILKEIDLKNIISDKIRKILK